MEYKPIITKTAMIFDLKKPIFGSYYMIWDKWLNIAKRRKLHIVVNTQFGKATYTYTTWMKGAKKGEREYNFPGNPMVFYGRHVLPDIKAREERKKVERKKDQDYTKKGATLMLKAWKQASNV